LPELTFAYHDIAPRRPGDRYTIDAATFERHVEAFGQSGSDVLLTFDDGMRSAIEVVAPILERHALRATFFMITKAISKPNYLGVDELRALRDAGHTIGSHTHNHPRNPYLKDLPDDRVSDEWRRSKALLEDILDAPVTAGSIPYGFYTPRLARLAAAEGYEHVYVSTPFTTPKRIGGALVHGRFGVTVATPGERVAALARGDHRAIVAERVGWTSRRVVKGALGPLWLSVRGALLARRHS